MSRGPSKDGRGGKQDKYLSHDETLRARSWLLDIVGTLVPGQFRDYRDDRQFLGGLRIHRISGAWFSHPHAKGGHDAVPLVALLQGYNHTEAAAWVLTWLAAHPGRGEVVGAETDDIELSETETSVAITEASLQRAAATFAALVPLEETTPGAIYLRKRAISMPFPAWVRWLPPNIARCGEGAVVALLESGGVVVGMQGRFITTKAAKSQIEPTRFTYLLERSNPRTKSATFGTLPDPAKPLVGRLLIGEGVEDALSLLQELSQHTTVGVPGVGVISRLQVAKGADIVVCRDGDKEDKPANKGLIAGLDHLLLQGAVVTVTTPELESDNNDVLAKGGGDALRALVAAAVPAELSLEGEATRCARMDEGDYDRERLKIADRLGVRVKTMDHARQDARRKVRQREAAAQDGGPLFLGTPDLCSALDAGMLELRRYIVAPDHSLAVALLWIVTTHLVHNVRVNMQRCCILKLQAPTIDSGKSTVAEALATLVPRPDLLSSYTAPAIVRSYQAADLTGAGRPTIILDEADHALPMTEQLQQILNATTRRKLANRAMAVKRADGTIGVEKVNLFGPLLLSGNGPSPASLASREVRFLLRRALAEDVPEKLIAETTPKLAVINDEIAAWAAAEIELDDPPLPDWLRRRSGRTAGNWLQLLAVALKAGGQWPALLQQAAEVEFTREPEVTKLERLLISVRKAFLSQPAIKQGNGAPVERAADDQGRIRTETLVAELNRDADEQWSRASGGHPVDAYFLREAFRNLLTPPGTRQWFVPVAGGTRLHCRGYGAGQFDQLCREYGVKLIDAPALGAEGTPSAVSKTNPPHEPPAAPDAVQEPDALPDGELHPVQQRSQSAAGLSVSKMTEPDEPDEIGAHARTQGGGVGGGGAEMDVDPVSELIKNTSAEHQTWSIDKIAKHLKQPKSTVSDVIQREMSAQSSHTHLNDTNDLNNIPIEISSDTETTPKLEAEAERTKPSRSGQEETPK